MTMRKPHPVETARKDPSVPQRRATMPDANVWVSASAGTGKTKVLTDRVLRLLLPREDGRPGTPPPRILCLTFTKAAASEMALRINETLGRWATSDDGTLNAALTDLLGRRPRDHEMEAARRLFAAVVDTPGGLKIMTIHSFCQSILGRFPLEAGLPPHFSAMEDGQAAQLLAQARDKILSDANRHPESPEGQALNRLAAKQNDEQFTALLRNLSAERHQLQQLLKRHGDLDRFYAALCRTLGVRPDESPESILRAACDDAAFAAAKMWQACKTLSDALKTDRDRGQRMQRWLELDQEGRIAGFNDWCRAFFKADGDMYKSFMTGEAAKRDPDSLAALQEEAERLLDIRDRINAAECAGLSCDLVRLGQLMLNEYEALKNWRGALDFDDLINRTLSLLQAQDMAPWVLFKLDGGLDHILIDEAQDTNPEQWEIVEALISEFFAGAGARTDTVRTLFTVGDEKQSIYSFQRAAPDKFTAKRLDFKMLAEDGAYVWDDVGLHTSFRSTPAVLDFVDAVFAPEPVRKGLGDLPLRHWSWRHGDAGLVELWPLFRVEQGEKSDPWALPVEIRDNRKAPALLAEHIAQTISGWLQTGEILESKGRPIDAGDILILVRRRSAFVNHMIRALKKHNVPVSGIDRMILKDQLAVQDLMAAAQVALLPEDDLSLACLLKSPFIGWDDARLEAVALGRGENTLWQAVRDGPDRKVIDWIAGLIARAGIDHPYEFFSRILQSPCPADTVSGLHAVTGRLGEEVLDPLDEFLNQALAFERDRAAALQGFLLWQQQGDSAVKREQEEAGGKVRIMTVHASKGLQAPIVILPDTVRTRGGGGPGASDHRLIWPDKTGLDVPLWTPRKDGECRAYRAALQAVEERQDEEYRRLLYVAMTRAGDRLYVCGCAGKNKVGDDSWYPLMAQAFDCFDDVETQAFAGPDGLDFGESAPVVRRLANPQVKTVKPAMVSDIAVSPDPTDLAYAWLYAPPQAEPDPPRPLIPSRPSGQDEEPAARSPLDADDQGRFLRGNVTHRLLQTLPDLPQSRRREAAVDFVAQAALGLSATVRDGIVGEVMAILEHPDYAPLFGPQSKAEVPLTGLIGGKLVSGQVDRLLVAEDTVWIVDYKTNRPPPRRAEDIPGIYRRQLRAYAETLALIYPNHQIRTFLLWTDGPDLMEVKLT